MRWLGPLGLAAVALAMISPLKRSAEAASAPRVYRNDAYRIRSFILPGNWELSSQGTYQNLLVAYSHGEGARITITAERRRPGQDADRLAVRSRPLLERQGFSGLKLRSDEGRTFVEGELTRKGLQLRQVYLCEGEFCYVLTLVVPKGHAVPVRDFDEAARDLVLAR